MKLFRPFSLFAFAFLLSASAGIHFAHAQAVGQACPDFTCDGDAVCKNGTCQAPVAYPNCSDNSTCASHPGQTCVAGTCGYAAGSSAANCLDTCSGTCNVDASGNATCSTSGLNGNTGATGGITGTTNASGGGINTAQLQGYEQTIVSIINTILVPLLVAVAFIFFLWGVFNYFIRGAAEPEKRQEGTQYILWAVVGFVVIFSVWGLVNLLMGTLNLTAGSLHPGYPTL